MVLIGLFLAIPYGMAADKYGRKWFMVLGITSLFLRASWTYTVCKSIASNEVLDAD